MSARQTFSCATDHAERLLVTDFGAYLDYYSPKGKRARERRPDH